MNQGMYIFSQLCDFLPTDHFKWLVYKYDGNNLVDSSETRRLIHVKK